SRCCQVLGVGRARTGYACTGPRALSHPIWVWPSFGELVKLRTKIGRKNGKEQNKNELICRSRKNYIEHDIVSFLAWPLARSGFRFYSALSFFFVLKSTNQFADCGVFLQIEVVHQLPDVFDFTQLFCHELLFSHMSEKLPRRLASVAWRIRRNTREFRH